MLYHERQASVGETAVTGARCVSEGFGETTAMKSIEGRATQGHTTALTRRRIGRTVARLTYQEDSSPERSLGQCGGRARCERPC